MRYVYFTKGLQNLDIAGVAAFLKEVGLDGADFTVRPGFPVTPDNVAVELPKAVRTLKDEGRLVVGMVTAPGTFTNAEDAPVRTLFEACGKAGVPAIKIGYFTYKDKFDAALAEAQRLAGFAKLAEKTGVKACYHTHSGSYLGNNGAGMRLLLQDLDAHHVGAMFDTGHTAINGGPPRMELDMIRPWLSLVSVKDMVYEKQKDVWRTRIAPAGEGIVRWDELAKGLKEVGFNGTITLHGEYEVKDLEERKKLAKQELALLKGRIGG